MHLILEHLASPGGPILVALMAISVATIAIAIFKAVHFARIGVGRSAQTEIALRLWAEGNRVNAIKHVRQVLSPTEGAVLEAMVSLARFPDDKERARDVAANYAMEQLNAMSRHLRFLETAAQAAPMLGLLGTVIGMISAFAELSSKGGAIDPAALASGIWVALIATAAGLSVAIPAYFLSTYFEGRVDGERASMEAAIGKVLFSLPPGASAATQTQVPGPAFGQTLPLGG